MNTTITKAEIERVQRETKEAEIKLSSSGKLQIIGMREIRPSDLVAVQTSNL